MSSDTPVLDGLTSIFDLRQLPLETLPQLADELRRDIITAASESGGHFGAGLGVVELTIALHYVYNTPDDRLIWDVSHQAYPHKVLTGRRERLRSIRKKGGLQGFTCGVLTTGTPGMQNLCTGHESEKLQINPGAAPPSGPIRAAHPAGDAEVPR